MMQTIGDNITLERGALAGAGRLFARHRRVLVLTDDGVPAAYAQSVAAAAEEPLLITLPHGEQNKCPETYLSLLGRLVEAGFDRQDAVAAVGGGVVGDLAGFVAATYMRGIAFYNVPTTLLSQIDSSVGGKVAIDFHGYKNTVGAFYPAREVLIDPEVLKTLDRRQMACGMAEAIKMFATSDGEMFARLEAGREAVPIDEIIRRALEVKLRVVNEDEREAGLRRVLNFGHTVGHAVESLSAGDASPLLHGECVAVGMLALTEGITRARIEALLRRYELPTSYRCERSAMREALRHDKKGQHDTVTTVLVPEIGSFRFAALSPDEILHRSSEVIEFV